MGWIKDDNGDCLVDFEDYNVEGNGMLWGIDSYSFVYDF